MGGTNIRGGSLKNDRLSSVIACRTNARGSVEEVLQDLFQLIDQLINNETRAIGLGVRTAE